MANEMTQPDELSDEEKAFRSLLASKAYAAWAREVRDEWAKQREADAARAVEMAQAEARRVEEKQAKKRKAKP